jgi:LacI family transcriptional regulator
MSDYGIEFNESHIEYCLHGGMLYNEVENALNKLIHLENKPDAIIASADKLTTNCLRFLKKNGFKVPEDIALVGFSNLDLTDLLSPTLTVVRQPAFEIGQISTDLLIQQIESKRPITSFVKKTLPPQLHIGESSDKYLVTLK